MKFRDAMAGWVGLAGALSLTSCQTHSRVDTNSESASQRDQLGAMTEPDETVPDQVALEVNPLPYPWRLGMGESVVRDAVLLHAVDFPVVLPAFAVSVELVPPDCSKVPPATIVSPK